MEPLEHTDYLSVGNGDASDTVMILNEGIAALISLWMPAFSKESKNLSRSKAKRSPALRSQNFLERVWVRHGPFLLLVAVGCEPNSAKPIFLPATDF